jgi:phenylalanyl-tRNA synthetase beta chain
VKLVLAWMKEFVDLPADEDAARVADRLAACGFEVAEVVDLPEPTIDFEITANRPDCLSVVGLAREAGVAYGATFSPGAEREQADSGESGVAVDVRLEDEELCPRYAMQVARVRIAPSPGWMQQRLLAAGVRPINNVVDVTNYVMIERGHPMHAFDLDTLAGRRIVVRRARPGERIRTLDGVDRTLEPDMLVIADAEHAAAIAGVMGGAGSEVSDRTTTIALESAWFLPRSVRVTSRRLGLKTEASARFERGADIEAPVAALVRAIDLLQRIGAGEAAGPVVDCYPVSGARPRVALRAGRIARLLGAAIPDTDVERILPALGFALDRRPDGSWIATVPSWRVDVAREADLVEEVGRHYGYDRLPMTFPPLRGAAPAPDVTVTRDRRARQLLLAAGVTEAMTFAFIERRAAEPFARDPSQLVALTNPLSEKFSVLRPSLLPGLVDALAHNRRHGRRDARLFEIGSVVGAEGERRRAALVWMGGAEAEHWSEPSRGVDFFDVRGVVETLCAAFGVDARFEPASHSYLVPGRTADVRDGGRPIGVIGQIDPSIVSARDLPGTPEEREVYAAELDMDAFEAGALTVPQVKPLPRFPSIVRDLSILVPERLPAAEVRGTIRSAAPPTLVELREFDRYRGKGIPEGRVSLSWHLTFRAPDRTLTDAEVDRAMGAIVSALETAHGAVRR